MSIFLENYLNDIISDIHILPFPFSSDDGFSVKDYYQINKTLGNWTNIEKIAGSFRLMSDLVINHCSAHHDWFRNSKIVKVLERLFHSSGSRPELAA